MSRAGPDRVGLSPSTVTFVDFPSGDGGSVEEPRIRGRTVRGDTEFDSHRYSRTEASVGNLRADRFKLHVVILTDDHLSMIGFDPDVDRLIERFRLILKGCRRLAPVGKFECDGVEAASGVLRGKADRMGRSLEEVIAIGRQGDIGRVDLLRRIGCNRRGPPTERRTANNLIVAAEP